MEGLLGATTGLETRGLTIGTGIGLGGLIFGSDGLGIGFEMELEVRVEEFRMAGFGLVEAILGLMTFPSGERMGSSIPQSSVVSSAVHSQRN